MISIAEKQLLVMANAMQHIEDYTCIRFNYRSTEKDYVYIYNGDSCSSAVGRVGGKQEISLDSNGCISTGTVLHERE